MGEAKRRADAHAAARPFPPPRACPRCKSIRIARTALPPTALSHRPTVYDLCRACGTVWEAYPENWCADAVGAEPCDNCAFRPDSPEQKDPVQWRELIAQLKAGNEFKCHKGAPILGILDAKPRADGNCEVEFDADWINARGRACAGFIRMVWAMRDKGENWLDRRYGLTLPQPSYPPKEETHGQDHLRDDLKPPRETVIGHPAGEGLAPRGAGEGTADIDGVAGCVGAATAGDTRHGDRRVHDAGVVGREEIARIASDEGAR